MQVYHKDLLENEAMISKAKLLYEQKFISKEQLNEVSSKLVSLDTNPNLLVRFGFSYWVAFCLYLLWVQYH